MGGSTTNQMMNEWWVNDDWMRMVLIDDSATNQIPTIHFPSTADVFQVWLCLPIPFLEGTCCLRSSTRQEFRRTKTSQGSKTLFPCSNDPILFNFIDTTFDIWNICVYRYIYITQHFVDGYMHMYAIYEHLIRWMNWFNILVPVTSRDYAKLRGSLVDSTSGESTNVLLLMVQKSGKKTPGMYETLKINGRNYPTSTGERRDFRHQQYQWLFQICDWPGVAPPKLCFGLFHCCLKRYVARRQLVSAEYVSRRINDWAIERWLVCSNDSLVGVEW